MKRIAVFSFLALMAALLPPASSAVAAHGADLHVQVASPIFVGKNCDPDSGRGCRFGESMRFLAPTLNVHKGDTLTFDFAGFHTASLQPVDADSLGFRGANTGGIDKPFSLLVSDPDDSTEEGASADKPAVKANPAVMNRTIDGVPVTCGSEESPCDYDGSTVVNSGLPTDPSLGSFSVTINAEPGQDFWIECFVHTHMFLKVNVVADTAATTTQEQIDASKAAQIAIDQEWAEETDNRLLHAKSSRMTPSGRVHDVKAGVDSHFANLNAFYPKKLSIRKGETVRYHFNQLVYEDHTVTMPRPAAFSLFDEFFVPGCDADGDSGTASDVPFADGPPCGGDFSQIEVDITSRAMWGMGNGVLTGRGDLENSGIRGAHFSMSSYDMKFKATSDKGWKAFCLIHGPGMGNRVVVKPRT